MPPLDAFTDMNRWITFNLVGAGGVAVQLGVLALLVRTFHWHFLPATAIAVEAAVLHNFFWHQRWTWRDRPSTHAMAGSLRTGPSAHVMAGSLRTGPSARVMAGSLRTGPSARVMAGSLRTGPSAHPIARPLRTGASTPSLTAGLWWSSQSAVARLVRFNLLNGAISIAGNLALMSLLSGLLHIDPLAASIVAIVACSLLNFVASERVVFRSTAPIAAALLLFGVSAAAAPADSSPPRAEAAAAGAPSDAAGPDAQALAAWRQYEASLDQRYANGSAGPFFAEDRDNAARGWRDTAAGGGVSMVKIDVASVPGAKIHHWAGSIFVPGVTLDAVLDRLKRSAGHESDFYDDVTASRLLARDGDRVNVFMKLRRTALITVTYNTEHAVVYRRLSATRASARSVATKIAELDDAGTAGEREKPAADDSGFLWRLNAYWRYEAVAGGVLVECESVSLSRPVPYLVRPIANPIVDKIARDSLERTLHSLRAVLTGQASVQAR